MLNDIFGVNVLSEKLFSKDYVVLVFNKIFFFSKLKSFFKNMLYIL